MRHLAAICLALAAGFAHTPDAEARPPRQAAVAPAPSPPAPATEIARKDAVEVDSLQRRIDALDQDVPQIEQNLSRAKANRTAFVLQRDAILSEAGVRPDEFLKTVGFDITQCPRTRLSCKLIRAPGQPVKPEDKKAEAAPKPETKVAEKK